MVRQKSLQKRKFLKQNYYRLKFKKQFIYTTFLKYIMKSSFVNKQTTLLVIYYTSFLLRSSSISNLLKVCGLNPTYQSINNILKLHRLTSYEMVSTSAIPGFKSIGW